MYIQILFQVVLPVALELPPDTWVVVIEQLLLYFMIIGRWILPRGKISRNELSQLLFVFIGMASDITELFTLFDEDPVRESVILTYIILTMWTVSLVQFCFVLTATKSPTRSRVALQSQETTNSKRSCATCCKTELWSILLTMFMQDLPFLCIRTYTLVTYRLITYSIIFFTAKNILVVLLLWYRICVICFSKNDNCDGTDEESQTNKNNSETIKRDIRIKENVNKTTDGIDKTIFSIVPDKNLKINSNSSQRKYNGHRHSQYGIANGGHDFQVNNIERWVQNGVTKSSNHAHRMKHHHTNRHFTGFM